jgi:hypothetical protein
MKRWMLFFGLLLLCWAISLWGLISLWTFSSAPGGQVRRNDSITFALCENNLKGLLRTTKDPELFSTIAKLGAGQDDSHPPGNPTVQLNDKGKADMVDEYRFVLPEGVSVSDVKLSITDAKMTSSEPTTGGTMHYTSAAHELTARYTLQLSNEAAAGEYPVALKLPGFAGLEQTHCVVRAFNRFVSLHHYPSTEGFQLHKLRVYPSLRDFWFFRAWVSLAIAVPLAIGAFLLVIKVTEDLGVSSV